jgi:copper transport protein
MTKRVLAVAALVVALVAFLASPASAHATLLTTTPQAGGIYDTPPGAVSLRFNEPVEVSLGGVRVFSGSQSRVVTGSPKHPGGAGNEVSVSLPKLKNGTYVVTWRVISADSHPVEGAYVPGRAEGDAEQEGRAGRGGHAAGDHGRERHRRRGVRHRPRGALRVARLAHRRHALPARGVAARA